MEALQTRRLTLRQWEESDRGDLFEYASGSVVGPSAGWEPHKTPEDSGAMIERLRSYPDCYAIVLREQNKVIGCIGLYKTSLSDGIRSQSARELGFSLNPAFWGLGYATEAARAVLAHGFDTLALDTIFCAHFDFNLGSARVCQKLGFTYTFERRRRYAFMKSRPVTERVYFLTQEQFHANAAIR
ncbi:MAG: GNAT family N-acetyltransferase [Oscillospiraceae bacterium]|nr:GNAT family N-acetyltransferase [Oscillospiraceae bacterium]